MAQCKKTLPDGERCSNRAVPGSDYCETHGRIQFHRVASDAVPTPAPTSSQPPAAPKTRARKKASSGVKEDAKQKAPAPPAVTARPSSLGESPKFPGLRADARNILVGDEGLIRLGETESSGAASALSDRLAALISLLSQKITLEGQVDVRVDEAGYSAFIRLTPRELNNADPSRFYDIAAEAARPGGGMLYVGSGQTFIQYRDESAPRGYDAEGVQPPRADEMHLVGAEGTQVVLTAALKSLSQDELLLRVAPIPSYDDTLPAMICALAPSPLYRMLARYFGEHYLRYRVARFNDAAGGTNILFEVMPRGDAPTGPLVPAFVISYLNALPRTVVLTDVSIPGSSRRLLVQWRRRHPCLLQNVFEVFEPDSLVAFTASPDYGNLYVSPGPAFFEGDELTSVKLLGGRPIKLTPVVGGDQAPLEVHVRLVSDNGPAQPIAALLLGRKEVGWVQHLLYRLPEDTFTGCSVCVGEEGAVILSEGAPMEAIPFGIPLRRIQNTNLFIQQRTRFMPELSWPLLARTLNISDDRYTFLTLDSRLDAPRESFALLSRMLVAESGRPRVELKLLPQVNFPDLKWQPPPEPERALTPPGGQSQDEHRRERGPQGELQREPEREGEPRREPQPQRSLWSRIASRRAASEQQPAPPPERAHKERAAGAATPPVEDVLKARAESFINTGDFLGAAFCYALIGDQLNAAKYYRVAARQVKVNQKDGSTES